MQAEAIYKGATRPAMKFGVPLVPLVVLFGTRHAVTLWVGTWSAGGSRPVVLAASSRARLDALRDPQGRPALPADVPRAEAAAPRSQPRASGSRAATRPTCTAERRRCLAPIAERQHARPARSERTAGRALDCSARARTRSRASSRSRRSSRPHDVITRGGDYLRVWRLDGVPFECADEHTDRRTPRGASAACSATSPAASSRSGSTGCTAAIDDSCRSPQEPGFARDLAAAYDRLIRSAADDEQRALPDAGLPPERLARSRALQSRRRSRARDRRTRRPTPCASWTRSRPWSTVCCAASSRACSAPSSAAAATTPRWPSSSATWSTAAGAPIPVHAGPLYRTLPTARLSFGADKLEIRHGDERRYAAFVDIQEYADAVEPGVLDALLYERSEFIETQSFSILPRREAMRSLELQRDQLIASDDVVASQVAEMDVALERARRRPVLHGRVPLLPARLRRQRRRRRPARGPGDRRRRRSVQPADAAGRPRRRRRLVRADARQLAVAAARGQAVVARLRRTGQRPQLRARQARRQPVGRSARPPAHAQRPAVLPEPAQEPRGRRLRGQEAARQHAGHRLDRRRQDDARDAAAGADPQVEAGAAPRPLRPRPRQRDRPARARRPLLHAGSRQAHRLQPAPARADASADPVLGAARPHLPRDRRAAALARRRAGDRRRGALRRLDAAGLRRFSTVRQNLPKTGENSLYERLGRWCQGGALGWVFDEADDRLPTCRPRR